MAGAASPGPVLPSLPLPLSHSLPPPSQYSELMKGLKGSAPILAVFTTPLGSGRVKSTF